MKYVLLICDDETASPSNEELSADPVHQAWLDDLERRGGALVGERLRPVVDATTVRVRDGETLVSDGPYAETKDFVGGIVIVDCPTWTTPSRSPRATRTHAWEASRSARSGSSRFRWLSPASRSALPSRRRTGTSGGRSSRP